MNKEQTRPGRSRRRREPQGFYIGTEQVKIAMEQISRFAWAERMVEEMKRECDDFLELEDAFVYDVVLSMRGQTFAYGITGCPSCGSAYPARPEELKPWLSGWEAFPAKKVTCPACRVTVPNERYPDGGSGFEQEGKACYPIGMWNFAIAGEWLGGVRNHEGLVTKLTYLYMLTGEERYARRAIVLLDAFSAIWEGTIGPRDFTPFGSSCEIGRLHLLTSIVFRIKVFLAHDYDWLSRLPEMDEPSLGCRLAGTGEGMSVRDNIERMLDEYLLDEPGGPVYDLRGGRLTLLNNHEADGVRAMLAVGLALDVPSYGEWGIQAVKGFFYNAIGRDGMYFEGSFGYFLFTIGVLLDMALLAQRTAEAKGMGESFQPFNSRRFFRFAVQNPLAMCCQGHLPSYGDWGRDETASTEIRPEVLSAAYRAALHFAYFATDADIRAEARAMLAAWRSQAEPLLGSSGLELFLPHEVGDEPGGPAAAPKSGGVTVAGQGGYIVLRDKHDMTLLTRYGPNLTHAHDDVLSYQWYADGREITADLGYGIYGTNSHFGWASKAIAHPTVVLRQDEQIDRGQIYKPFAGGEAAFIYERDGWAAAECAAPELYEAERYQRLLAAVPLSRGRSYVLDIFDVVAAGDKDLALHAFHEASRLEIAGWEETETAAWTLAGALNRERSGGDLYYDRPGLSFGERLTTGETFNSLQPGEEERLWTAAPNNGYGYIYGIRKLRPDESRDRAENPVVHACWKTADAEAHWHIMLDGEETLYTGTGPNLDGSAVHPFFIIHSGKEAKRFISVSYAGNDVALVSVQKAAVSGLRGGTASVLTLVWSDGTQDLWLYSPDSDVYEWQAEDGMAAVAGRCGCFRLRSPEQEQSRLHPIRAEELRFTPAPGRAPGRAEPCTAYGYGEEEYEAARIDGPKGQLIVRGLRLAAGREPRFIALRGARRAAAMVYPARLEESGPDEHIVHLLDDMIVSTGIVAEAEGDRIATKIPLPFAAPGTGRSAFCGMRVVGACGGQAVIRDVPDLTTLRIEPIHPFQAGEAFDIVDLDDVMFIRLMG
ncbi:hypothetical protein ABD76_11330 [Paenibacillus dendritiformis]|uniref:heparinase II/III domain-containing protein n=1 Tax=Paenibacillus dendritiformis TaxID=130049 RepID=UPI0018CEE320|nr:heparinase II/III family protein [Paenibacillus dendritiformis]MBG9793046.1 hypothetical protein [Paenibacillus dendritiformis]